MEQNAQQKTEYASEIAMKTEHTSEIETPMGPLLMTEAGGRIIRLAFCEESEELSQKLSEQAGAALQKPSEQTTAAPQKPSALAGRLQQELNEYFAGVRKSFDLPLDPQGTPFQLEVWKALCEIPWGETICYSELAQRIGRPKAARAVGMANHHNPIPILIPCHRVIGKNRTLTGYAGGLHRKEFLLKVERIFFFS